MISKIVSTDNERFFITFFETVKVPFPIEGHKWIVVLKPQFIIFFDIRKKYETKKLNAAFCL